MHQKGSSLTLVAVGMVVSFVISGVSAQTSCSYSGGYDLSSIGTTTLSLTQMYQNKASTHTFVFNLCQNVLQPPPNTAIGNECAGAGYISEYSGTPKCEMYFPRLTGTTAGTNSLTLTFGAGPTMNPTWSAVVNLNCDSTVPTLSSPGNVIVTQLTGGALQFVFDLTTQAVCPGGVSPPASPASSGGCDAGCAFVIIVLVGGFVYVVATVVFYYFRQGKRGMELLPHPDFWKEFAALVKEGAIFSVQKIRALVCKTGPYAGDGYQAV